MGGGTHARHYFHAQFHRLSRRLGKQKAIVAVAHSILTIIYCMLLDGTAHREMGRGNFDTLDTARIERHHVHRLEQLGYTVTLQPSAAA